MFLFQLLTFFQNFKELLSRIKNILQVQSLIITHIKKYSTQYLISIAVLVLLTSLFFIFQLKDIIFTKNIYSVTLKGTEVTLKSPTSGKIAKLNSKLVYLIRHPNDSVEIFKDEPIVYFDTTTLDNDLAGLRSSQFESNGPRTVTTEQVTESPDETELLSIQSRIDNLRIQKTKNLANLQAANNTLHQAEQLYEDKVVTQSFLDDARKHYQDLFTESLSLDLEISNQEKLYEVKSKLNTKTRVIVQSQKETTGSDVSQQISNINNQISQKINLRRNSIVYADSDIIVTKLNIFVGKEIKINSVLIQGFNPGLLQGEAKLNNKDVELVKQHKVKIFYQNNGIKTELDTFTLNNNKISFKMNQSATASQIIVERVLK